MAKKNPAVLWNVDQTGDVIGVDGRTTAQGNVGLGDDFVKSSKTSKKYVTHVSRNSDGTLKVNVVQPSLSDLNATTANRSIGTNSSGVIEAQDLSDVTHDADNPTTGTTYVSSITQETNGQVKYKTQTVTRATDEAHGGNIGITTLISSMYPSNTRTIGNDTAVTPNGVWNAIDSAINSLDVTDSAVTNQFITSVSESDGIISVTRAQPSIGDLVASSNTNYSIGTNSLTGKIEAQNLTVSTATDGGDSDDLTFVSSITQASNGKISVTTKHVPYSIQLIDPSYTYEQVLELIADGKYPVVRYQNGYDTLYLPMFTAPASSGTYIEFRGFAKNSEDTIYKIACAPETGFGDLTSTTFVSISDASNFIDNFTYDSATASNQPGSVTLKYHKYNSDYTGILTLKGDLDSGIVIRNVTPAETPSAFKIVNQRPIPTYTTNYKDRILSVNSAGTGLEWRALANADWNATSGPSQILNKPTIPSIQYKSYGGDPTDVDTLLIDADDPEGYVRVGTNGNTMGLLVEGPYKTLLNSGINEGSGVGDKNTPVYITSDGTFDTCLTRSDVDFILFSYSDPNPQDNVYAAIEASRANNRLPVLYCGMGGGTAFWIFSGEGSIGYSFSRNTSASCSRATIGPDHVFTITEQLIAAGDVVGPSSSTDSRIPLFDGTTGKLLKNSQFHFSTYAMSPTGADVQYVKTKSYYDVFSSSQQILANSSNNTVLYIGNQHRLIRLGIDNNGSIVLGDQHESRTQGDQYEYTLPFDYSPSTNKTIIGSSGTGDSTTYRFYGLADKASKIDTTHAIGANNQPVYVAVDGTVTACNFQVVIGSLPTTTDTIAFL